MLSNAQSALISARFRGVVVAALSDVLQAHSPNLGWEDSKLRECFGDVDRPSLPATSTRCELRVPMHVVARADTMEAPMIPNHILM